MEHLRPVRCKNNSKGYVSYVIIAVLTAILLIIIALFYFSPETVTKLNQAISQNTETSGSGEAETGGEGSDPAPQNGEAAIELSRTEPAGISPGPESVDQVGASAENDAENQQQGLAEADRGADIGTCIERAGNIEAFYTMLDTRDYIKGFQLETPSIVYFSNLIQKLVDNPPIVSGETDDLFTILQNTAHFFRIIGKKNILVLKGILDREKDTFEQTLADFYRLTGEPGCLKKHFDLTIPQDALYAYSGFFLNTMGGRLYLFRRDSMSRMVVSFYAILIVEHANREGRNKYGIEIKDAIDNLIIEIESSRIQLKMRDEYLDTLYDLKVAYQ